jgi:hypothetical protein
MSWKLKSSNYGTGGTIGVVEQSSSERKREKSQYPVLLRGPIRTVSRSDARPRKRNK